MKNLKVIVLLAAIAAVTAWAQSGVSGTVSGTVTASGSPLVGIRVVASSRTSSSYTAKANTASDGTFTFLGVPLGGIDLKAYDSSGNVIATASGNVNAGGQIITVNLTVPAK